VERGQEKKGSEWAFFPTGEKKKERGREAFVGRKKKKKRKNGRIIKIDREKS